MGSMPGWFAKPAEFWLFDEYFGPGPDLAGRLQEMCDGLAEPEGFDTPYWVDFWNKGNGSGLDDQARDHFLSHWLGGEKATNFFPRVKKDGADRKPVGHNLLVILQRAMHKAASLALEDAAADGAGAKPLSLVWSCAPGADGFFGVGVANGPHTVVITITTPEFVRGVDGPVTLRADQGWSWRIDGEGAIDDSTSPINVNDAVAYNETIAERYPAQPGESGS